MQTTAHQITAQPAIGNEISTVAACGRYESSFDLRAGLTVIEDLDPVLFELWMSSSEAGARPGVH